MPTTLILERITKPKGVTCQINISNETLPNALLAVDSDSYADEYRPSSADQYDAAPSDPYGAYYYDHRRPVYRGDYDRNYAPSKYDHQYDDDLYDRRQRVEAKSGYAPPPKKDVKYVPVVVKKKKKKRMYTILLYS